MLKKILFICLVLFIGSCQLKDYNYYVIDFKNNTNEAITVVLKETNINKHEIVLQVSESYRKQDYLLNMPSDLFEYIKVLDSSGTEKMDLSGSDIDPYMTFIEKKDGDKYYEFIITTEMMTSSEK